MIPYMIEGLCVYLFDTSYSALCRSAIRPMSEEKKLHYFGSCLPFAPVTSDNALFRAMQRLAMCSTLLTTSQTNTEASDMRMGIDPDTDGIYYYHEDDFERQVARYHGTLDPAPSGTDG